MRDTWIVILGLTAGTFAIRLGGILLGQQIPTTGPWARGLRALPGCLVAMSLVSGGGQEWTAAAIAAAVAIVTRNLPATMAAGIAAIWALRHFA